MVTFKATGKSPLLLLQALQSVVRLKVQFINKYLLNNLLLLKKKFYSQDRTRTRSEESMACMKTRPILCQRSNKDYLTKRAAKGATLTLTLEDNITTSNIKQQESLFVELSCLQEYFWKGHQRKDVTKKQPTQQYKRKLRKQYEQDVLLFLPRVILTKL